MRDFQRTGDRMTNVFSHAIAPSCTFSRSHLYMEAMPVILMEVGNKEY
ncbi:hypothetical protein HCG51_01115 [Tolypothrix sp. PCC 7910]|nr:hypothetical protein [Tolypothrix sp. PCC 7910]QIR35485.1 hypothetical protein HCG51_01115 [Tolypothrix sp. PCC 7910]